MLHTYKRLLLLFIIYIGVGSSGGLNRIRSLVGRRVNFYVYEL